MTNEEHDDSSVWVTLALLTTSRSPNFPEFSKEDEKSHRAFENWASAQTSNIGVRFKVLDRDLRNMTKLDQMEK